VQSAELLFQQDLNGDGRVGPPPLPSATIIESFGATKLVTAGNKFYLQDSNGNGPVLSSGGADVVVGQFQAWTPIAAEQTGGGYEVAWKNGSADQYTAWTVDANGNFTGRAFSGAGSDPAVQSAELLFQQDLNGDGRVGPPPLPSATIIESFGATKLVTAGNKFYLQDSNGNGPVLSSGGADVVVGQFQAWTPIAAEQTGGGYEVAWKNGSADQYTAWTVDETGNSKGRAVSGAGSDPAVESAELLFQQDLNGDGRVEPLPLPS